MKCYLMVGISTQDGLFVSSFGEKLSDPDDGSEVLAAAAKHLGPDMERVLVIDVDEEFGLASVISDIVSEE